ncbi:hypothetical protein D3C81_1415710 [compost metagenome]
MAAKILEFVKRVGVRISQDRLALRHQYPFDNLAQAGILRRRDQIRPELVDGVAQPHGRNIAGQHKHRSVLMTMDGRFQRIFVTPFKHLHDFRAMLHLRFHQRDDVGLG